MASGKSYRSSIVELFTRLISFEKKDNIYTNGDDNNYPERIERIINNSTTSKMCANKLGTFIYGKGFENNPLVNKKKNLNLNDNLLAAIESLKYHKGFYIHVNYDIDGAVNYTDILSYKKCRISKEDDLGYEGAIYYADEWGKQGFIYSRKSKKAKWFYPFNSDIEVINAQRLRDAKPFLLDSDTLEEKSEKLVKNYRGQVLFVNLEPQYVYPLAYIDPAYNDSDSEYRTSIFKNTNLRNGFVGKMVITLLKAEDDDVKKQIEKDYANLLGAEETGGVLIHWTELDSDGKLIPVALMDAVPSNIDDKLYQYTEESIGNAIMTAYGIHPALVKTSHKMFGSSGEEMMQIKKDFQNTTEKERQAIENAFFKIYKVKNEIIKLIKDD